jgi:hypothetical protein
LCAAEIGFVRAFREEVGLPGRFTLPQVDTGFIQFVGNLVFVHIESIQIDSMNRLLIRVSPAAAHAKVALRNKNQDCSFIVDDLG